MPAFHAAVPMNRAVKLQHLLAARRLMQAVDILGDDRLALASALQLRQRQMGGVGLCLRIEHHPAVKIPEFIRVSDKVFMREHFFIAAAPGGVVNALMGAAEIRDAAGGRHARPAEKYDIPRLRDPLPECFRFFGHYVFPLSEKKIKKKR